jgi:hypothetical protein
MLSELQNGKAVYKKLDNVVFDTECDVLVAGLGTCGAIAAISAAENGAKVIGVERLKMCGGVSTGGGICRYYFGLPGGRFEQVDEAAGELTNKHFINGNNKRHPYAKSHVLEQNILTAGGDIYYESVVAGIYLEDSKIHGVKVISRGKNKNIACRILLDGTGDGEVCAAAGASFEVGRQVDGKTQPYSSMRTFVSDKQKLALASFDAGHISPDVADNMTAGILQANALHRGNLEEYGDNLLWLTLVPGVREGRLIAGDVRLGFKDFMTGKFVDNPVAYAYSNFDSHTQDWTFESDEIKDWIVVSSLWGHNCLFPLPAEIMFVKGFDNLICSSRCISIDHDMASAIRMQRGLQKLGEAAGVIAALAVRDSVSIRNVNRDELNKTLHDSGAFNVPEEFLKNDFELDDKDLQTALASDAPGKAIWQCGRNANKYRKMLLKNICSDNVALSRNSALALGMGGEVEAVPKLIEIVRTRDAFEPVSSRIHNQRRLFGAIYLLGKLGELKSLEVLLDFIQLPKLDVQEFSHTFMALLKYADNIKFREVIVKKIKKILDEDCPEYKLLLKVVPSSSYETYIDITESIREIFKKHLQQWHLD